MASQERVAIVVSLRSGKTAADITAFQRPPNILFDFAKQKLDDKVLGKSYRVFQWRVAIGISEFADLLQNMIYDKPRKFISSLALLLNIGEKDVWSCVYEIVKYKFYTFNEY